ncbi:DUF397 domain-containing protein [Streptomyces sp. TS71-3]|uniref:DUF397 domain-containing protein n=1 Tax=Streptomyces sp. TS71-3 TaxID=2733862 RepID=UPI001B178B2A|nr:DUF397 domain-containing protein [Streptomyces sp. TS71-3]GHJ35138.1 toxin [Streptomyces sp. TS71-3]
MDGLHIPDASVLTGWRKSSYSGPDNGDCLEITDASTLTAWRKSSYSGGDNGSCVEVHDLIPDLVPVRDSKNPTGPAVVFPATGWTTFVAAVKNGQCGERSAG